MQNRRTLLSELLAQDIVVLSRTLQIENVSFQAGFFPHLFSADPDLAFLMNADSDPGALFLPVVFNLVYVTLF